MGLAACASVFLLMTLLNHVLQERERKRELELKAWNNPEEEND